MYFAPYRAEFVNEINTSNNKLLRKLMLGMRRVRCRQNENTEELLCFFREIAGEIYTQKTLDSSICSINIVW